MQQLAVIEDYTKFSRHVDYGQTTEMASDTLCNANSSRNMMKADL